MKTVEQITEYFLAQVASSVMYSLMDSSVSSTVAYDIDLATDGSTLGFSLDTLINGVDFRVELSGAGFSKDVADQNFSIDRIEVLLVDAEHTINSPWLSWQAAVDIQVTNGTLRNATIISDVYDAEILSTHVQERVDDVLSRLELVNNLNEIADELWLRVTNNQGFFYETIDTDAEGQEIGSLITRKYFLADQQAIAEVNIHGQDMSIADRQDQDFSVFNVDGTVTFLDPDMGDQNLVNFTLDLRETVVDGWVKEFEFNGIDLDFSGLKVRLDSELENLEVRIIDDLDLANLSVQALADALGWSTFNQDFAPYVSVNDEGTRISFVSEGVEGLQFEFVAQGSGFSNSTSDNSFIVSEIQLLITNDAYPATHPLVSVSRAIDLEVIDGSLVTLKLNESSFETVGLQSYLADEFDAAIQSLHDRWDRTNWSVQTAIDFLGWSAYYQDVAPYTIVNSDGTEISLISDTGTDVQFELVVHGAGFSNSVADNTFSISAIDLYLLDDTHTSSNPLALATRALDIEVVDGAITTWDFQDLTFEVTELQALIDDAVETAQNKLDGSGVSVQAIADALGWSGFHQTIDPYLSVSDDGSEIYLSKNLGLGLQLTFLVSGSGFSDSLLDENFTVSDVELLLTDETHTRANPIATASKNLNIEVVDGVFSDSAPTFFLTGYAKHWKNGLGIQDVALSLGGRTSSSAVDGFFTLDDVQGLDGSEKLSGSLAEPTTKTDASISLTDVLGALKVYLGKPLPTEYNSSYKYIAADFQGDGDVDLSDVLGLLKYYLGKPVDSQPEWVFVDSANTVGLEPASDVEGMALSKEHAMPAPISVDLTTNTNVDLVGVLRGDVDGSWMSAG